MMSRLSIGVLLAGGFALRFGVDTILPRLAPGVPTSVAWLGVFRTACGWPAKHSDVPPPWSSD